MCLTLCTMLWYPSGALTYSMSPTSSPLGGADGLETTKITLTDICRNSLLVPCEDDDDDDK